MYFVENNENTLSTYKNYRNIRFYIISYNCIGWSCVIAYVDFYDVWLLRADNLVSSL